MASDSDTLNLGSLRGNRETAHPQAPKPQAPQPSAAHDPVNHPEIAQIARARIAAIPEAPSVIHPDAVPAAPTADLVTDKKQLKHKLDSLGTVTRPQIPSAVRPLLTAVGVFALVLLLFKAPVILSQASYAFGPKPSPQATATQASSEIIPAENTITIPKINVHAPVVYESSIQEADVQKSLEDGVVHYGNTALPGQAGNAAIFGHSSNDWWEPGNYKFVFVLLDKLAPGDQFTVDYQSRRYTYEVTGSKVVEPTDMSVLAPTKEPTMTLITCTPPGTSLRRLVVTAKQVDPAPQDAPASSASPDTKAQANLPGSAPGFFNQVKQAWNGVVHGFKSLFGADNTKPATDSAADSAGQLPTAK